MTVTSRNRDRVVTDFRKVKHLWAKTFTFGHLPGGLVAGDCKRVDLNKEVSDFLAKVVILVRRSDMFEQKVLILLRRCDSDLAKP